jgi:hypothetical protein
MLALACRNGWMGGWTRRHPRRSNAGRKRSLAPKLGSPTDLYQNEFVQEVIRQALARILRGQLALKFGRLPKWVDERLQAASALQLQRWSIRILTAGALEGVFRKKPHRTML